MLSTAAYPISCRARGACRSASQDCADSRRLRARRAWRSPSGGAAALALAGRSASAGARGALALALAWEAGAWPGALRAIGAGAVGLLVAGVQLLPSFFHFTQTAVPQDLADGVDGLGPRTLAHPRAGPAGAPLGPDPLMDEVYEGLAGPGRC